MVGGEVLPHEGAPRFWAEVPVERGVRELIEVAGSSPHPGETGLACGLLLALVQRGDLPTEARGAVTEAARAVVAADREFDVKARGSAWHLLRELSFEDWVASMRELNWESLGESAVHDYLLAVRRAPVGVAVPILRRAVELGGEPAARAARYLKTIVPTPLSELAERWRRQHSEEALAELYYGGLMELPEGSSKEEVEGLLGAPSRVAGNSWWYEVGDRALYVEWDRAERLGGLKLT